MDFEISPQAILAEQAASIMRGAVELLPGAIAATFILVFTWIMSLILKRLVQTALAQTKMRPSLQRALRSLIVIGIWVAGALMAMTALLPSLTLANLLAGLGIGSIAVGLAFKDVFENFLAGLLILLRKPMRIGDDIEFGDVEGRVEEITIRDTYLRRRDGVLLIVPNAMIYNSAVRVLTDEPLRRAEIIVGVAYGEDVDAARNVISGALKGLSTVRDDKPVLIFAKEFNSSSIDFQVLWWTDSSPIEEERSRDEVVAAIKRALDDAGIEIPFPYRTLTFKEPLTIQSLGDAKE